MNEFRYEAQDKYGFNFFSLVFFLAILGGSAALAWLAFPAIHAGAVAILAAGFVAASYASLVPRVADQWERAVVLRLGRLRGLHGPGLFWVVPILDRVAMWVDMRVRTTGFAAERTLTKDTVPVNVDAVLFWTVWDAQKAALEVADYNEAVAWAAQTVLRDVIGKTELGAMLSGREVIDVQLRELIDKKTHAWGITVVSVEIRDVVIPAALEDAMSRQAQADRERQARNILSRAEVEIAENFKTAAESYQDHSAAFQLRAMNLLYEGMKERGSMLVVPSNAVEAMNLGTFAGVAALTRQGNGDAKKGGAASGQG